MTEIDDVREYVRREGSCEPDDVQRIRDGDDVPVYKVTVKKWDDTWTVPPPPYWLVCTEGATNLYRGDSYLPSPWAAVQDLHDQADYVRSMHLGLMVRLAKRAHGEQGRN